MLVVPPVYEVEEVVVTATRYPASLQDIALATLVIDREEFMKLEPVSLSELLQTYASVNIKDYGNPGLVSSISVRGIPSHSTLVLLNGIPLNSITVGMADLNAIDLNAVERIEVVKGPVSSLYGANALGGVVNIITAKEYQTPEVRLAFSPSTSEPGNPFQTTELSVRAGRPLGRACFDVTATYCSSDGFRQNCDYRGGYVTGSFQYKKGHSEFNSGLFFNSKEYGVAGPMLADSSSASPLDREKDRNLIGDLSFIQDLTGSLKWYNRLSAVQQRVYFHSVFIDWNGDTVMTDYDYLTHMLGFNTYMLLDAHNTETVAGIDVHYDTLETTETSGLSQQDTVWHAASFNIGFWLELTQKIGDITVTPSIRLDRNSKFGGFLSPAIGVVKPLLDNLWIKASAGKAFRAPTFNDLFWPGSGNPELRPEHGWAYELRLESAPVANTFAALSLFMRSVNDQIAWLPGEDNMWQPRNVNYISVKGMDFEFRTQFNEFIRFGIEGSYLYARQRNNEIVYDFYDWNADTGRTVIEAVERDAAFIPDYTASATLEFGLFHKTFLFIKGLFMDERVNYYVNYEDAPVISMDTKRLQPYTVFDVGLSKEFFSCVSISCGVKNLLDRRYALQFGNSMSDFDYPMPGRIFFCRVSMEH